MVDRRYCLQCEPDGHQGHAGAGVRRRHPQRPGADGPRQQSHHSRPDLRVRRRVLHRDRGQRRLADQSGAQQERRQSQHPVPRRRRHGTHGRRRQHRRRVRRRPGRRREHLQGQGNGRGWHHHQDLPGHRHPRGLPGQQPWANNCKPVRNWPYVGECEVHSIRFSVHHRQQHWRIQDQRSAVECRNRHRHHSDGIDLLGQLR